MKNSRGLIFDIGSQVKFQYPIHYKINKGIIKKINGEHVDIEVKINGKNVIVDRYRDEIIEVL